MSHMTLDSDMSRAEIWSSKCVNLKARVKRWSYLHPGRVYGSGRKYCETLSLTADLHERVKLNIQSFID